jgi:holo-[acyl-carrier protein] synthase
MTAHPELVHQLFTTEEQAYCMAQSDPSQHFAARFCAKEAVIKALALDGWAPLELEIVDGDPAPSVRLFGDIAKHAEALNVHVNISLTHLPAMAMAVAMAIPRSLNSSP